MRWLMWREFIVVARRPAIPGVSIAIAVVLTAFVLLWPHGMRVGSAPSVYTQTWLIAAMLFAILLPWAALRSASSERHDDLVLLSALTGWLPGEIVAAKTVAHVAVLILLAGIAAPALVLAQQGAGVPFASVAPGLLALAGIAVLAAAVTSVCSLLLRARVASWIAAAALTTVGAVLAWSVMGRSAWAGAVLVLASAAITAATTAWCNTFVRFVRERDA